MSVSFTDRHGKRWTIKRAIYTMQGDGPYEFLIIDDDGWTVDLPMEDVDSLCAAIKAVKDETDTIKPEPLS